MFNIPCVILCGGKSSRMGENKALLPFGNENSLIEFQYKRFQKIFDKVYISAKEAVFDFEVIKDEESGIFSPANALFSVIKRLQTTFIVVSVDTPFISEQIVSKLLEESKDKTITTIAKTEEKIHPLCAIYTGEILAPLENMLKENNHKLQFLIGQIPHKIVHFENENLFFNINNRTDYEKAKELFI